MSIIQAIILGIIQGLTEFIPVSSSGHLYLIPQLLGWATPSTIFITVLDWGTLIALIYYYRKLILGYLNVGYKYINDKTQITSTEDSKAIKIISNIIIATIPAVIIGFLTEKIISNFYDKPSSLRIASIITTLAMIVIGALFIYLDKFFKNNKVDLKKLTLKNALIIGVAQVFAFVRGVSRSGITLLAGEGTGLTAFDAAEFSFLMSIPIISISTLYETFQLFSLPKNELNNELLPAIVGSIFAFIFGMIAIKFMLKYLKKNGLKNFGYYRIAFGIIALIILILR